MSAHWIKNEHWLPDEMKQGWNWSLKKELMFGNPNKPLSLVFEILHQVHVHLYIITGPNISFLMPDKRPFTHSSEMQGLQEQPYEVLPPGVCSGQKHYLRGIHVCAEQQHVEENR